MKQSNNKLTLAPEWATLTYHYKDNYYIDIQVNSFKGEIGAWLYKSNYGIKDHILGLEYNRTDKKFEDFLELIETIIEECISDYKEQYED